MNRLAAALGLLGLMPLACRAGRTPEPAPFVCEGRQPPPAPSYGASAVAGEELELRLAGAEVPDTVPRLRGTDWNRLAEVRLSVRARMVPLSRLASELAAQLSANLLVDRRLVDVRVSLTLPDVSVGELVDVLEQTYPVHATYAWGTLAFESEFTRQQRAMRGAELEPTETQSVSLRDPARGNQIAALFCSHFASPRGTATVVGDSVIVSDSGDRVRHFQNFLREHEPW